MASSAEPFSLPPESFVVSTSDTFLPILTALHLGLGTAVALVSFSWRDWAALVRACFKTAVASRLDADPQDNMIWLVIIGTIPAGLLGVFLQSPIQTAFFAAQWAVLPAAFLALKAYPNNLMRRLGQIRAAQRMGASSGETLRLLSLGIDARGEVPPRAW